MSKVPLSTGLAQPKNDAYWVGRALDPDLVNRTCDRMTPNAGDEELCIWEGGEGGGHARTYGRRRAAH